MSVKQIYNPKTKVCSSQGLICFYETCTSSPNQSRAVIWNPTIGKSVDIDLPGLQDTTRTVIGFGVSPRTSDPKLVKITSGSISTHVEVFSLKSGFWRSRRSNGLLPRKTIVLKRKQQVVIDEVMYWLAYDAKGTLRDRNLIISFDMISEEFVELHLPERLSGIFLGINELRISKLKESLIVVEKTGSNLPVWIMQNGDPKSFTPIFTINTPVTSIRDVLGFRGSGEPIFLNGTRLNEDEFFVYEPNSKQIKPTRIYGVLKSFFVFSYTETLLLLDH